MKASLFARRRILVTRFALILCVSPLLFCSSAWDALSHVFSESLFALGIALVGVGVIGRVWCFSYISGRKQAELVTEGPYSLTRNPLYLFTLIAAVGIGFTSETLFVPLAVLALFALSYPAVIRQEERALEEIHGANFARYRESTPRFWPSFGLYSEPQEIQLNPRVFRRGLQDVVWFIVACGTFEIIEGLQEAGMVPVFMHLV
ncbi:isoprenylcysteine carboxylmethyltransferase family protein [Ruficoccus amylovorans]|uniref:Isoprenylcysteine carboxylmethyltransferase family protein n=1 Tax=Ruficoccus amylovorans TaxID=1804625 RepID=A0A842H931_9BACT|nr:isoprenylcysteine carboxylmethyltransferase family protein [Ruficoccus amylovorans]MBC2593033.1 isoprenylcysteine carboxylmethyltransferase family protein [Ruficoccus amylovorans]